MQAVMRRAGLNPTDIEVKVLFNGVIVPWNVARQLAHIIPFSEICLYPTENETRLMINDADPGQQVHDIINKIDDGTGSLSFTDFCQVQSSLIVLSSSASDAELS